MEQRIEIATDFGPLEGILDRNSDTRGVVITHPHPLYGGNMNNGVVHTISSTYRARNYTTLKFNFRGVDGSSGTYNDGIGEQDDVSSAMQYLETLGIKNIDLAGYSFGSWVLFNLSKQKRLNNRLVLISPPIDFVAFNAGSGLKNLDLVVAGDRDEFASIEELKAIVPTWNPGAKLEVINGIDHFYSSGLNQLSQILLSAI